MSEKRFLKDWWSNSQPVEEVKDDNVELLKMAEEQLEEIGPSLRDLVSRIVADKPDFVVFLDKSARVFAVPLLKRLRDFHLERKPQFRFYNDDTLKKMLQQRVDVTKLIDQDFSDVKGKKVFFIDDTFSEGKGADAAFAAADIGAFEASYFALSVADPSIKRFLQDKKLPSYYDRLNRALQTGNLTVYEHDIQKLFSRDAYILHIFEDFDERYKRTVTMGRYSMLSPEEADQEYDYEMKPDHIRNDANPEGAPNWKKYDERVRTLNLFTLRNLYQKMYATLKEG